MNRIRAWKAQVLTAVQAEADWPTLLGGSASPGNRWRLVFTTGTKDIQAALKGGNGSGKCVAQSAAPLLNFGLGKGSTASARTSLPPSRLFHQLLWVQMHLTV